MITQQELKEILNYDANTGIFTWKNTNKYSNRKINAIAGGYDSGYIRVCINKKRYGGHQLAWLYIYGEIGGFDIDHANGIKSDNRIVNLRKATVSENAYNRKLSSRNTSGIKGVTWHKKSKKWQVVVTVNKQHKYLGQFNDLEFAELVVSEARDLFHKDFANHGK
jgi:hypothetical protein